MLACKLVSVCQQGDEPKLKKIINDNSYPLPNFALDFDSDYVCPLPRLHRVAGGHYLPH